MGDLDFTKVQFIDVDAERAGQRIDNFLIGLLKGVPKSMVYRLLRKGEVRVNKKRIKPEYKLQGNDVLRLPPIRVSEQSSEPYVNTDRANELEKFILFEDSHLIVLNKPSGIAVHGGSGLSYGVIEAFRAIRPESKFLELVHRLDRDTSGCLMIAKRRSALKSLHEQIRSKTVDKRYLALVAGTWPKSRRVVQAPLHKNTLRSGERVVRVSQDGKPSETRYSVMQRYQGATLVEALPITGRTHQIRVHCQYAGHCIAGDPKYGDKQFEEDVIANTGLKRLFLHAHQLSFDDPRTGERRTFDAAMDEQLQSALSRLIPVE
ncbi:23S rRNA pseudouridine(955/2504/2580) synthase RluC [Paraneptunicella aestuarii]|uniref:23S rRNA pseudouridine(955/2504/2580) synthase RluC n=1 Tax=Paraneptunicella aestuarii TaxID=2831148 RepID=UPI001E3931C2|nr:23S rRNA pseudouridine(955/2504/2580) synthase RluC [Paraneptunicella aestuarii]UAA40403.1 23S rRNA pseudouridine(955/2504/2580) synthase RluC [Paraneptunicella aestuarii]